MDIQDSSSYSVKRGFRPAPARRTYQPAEKPQRAEDVIILKRKWNEHVKPQQIDIREAK